MQVVDGDASRIDDQLAVEQVRRSEVDEHVGHEHKVDGQVDDDERIVLVGRQEGGDVRRVDGDVDDEYEDDPIPGRLARRVVQNDGARQMQRRADLADVERGRVDLDHFRLQLIGVIVIVGYPPRGVRVFAVGGGVFVDECAARRRLSPVTAAARRVGASVDFVCFEDGVGNARERSVVVDGGVPRLDSPRTDIIEI